ncbi:MAG: exported protein of unknown function, partial [Nitrospira sp.]|nr:exported protein of unknown function [Nitrospira sp.]
MDGWSLFGRTNLWLYAIILNICSAFLASAADTKAPQQLHGEVSGITVHVPIPVTALAELYAGIHKDHVHRTEGREWIALGGGTGFLKYKLWPGEQGYTATGDLMLSQATFPFGVEYAKQINGSVTKIAECGQQDPATGTGRLSVSLTTTFAQGRSYGLLPTSTVTDVKPKRPCLLSEQGVDAAPLMAQIYRGHLQRKLSAVDRKATSLMALKPAVGRIWRDLEEPLLLDEEQAIWLVVNPESIGTAGIESLSGTPAAGFGVTARPVVVRGAQPVPKHLALPELQGRFTDDGFHVSFAMEVPMEEANQRLREAVVGQEWSLGVGTIKIAGATLYSLGDQIEVELTLRGLLPLTLRLKGTPAY